MKRYFKILIVILIISLGNPIRNLLIKKFRSNTSGSFFSKIERSLTDSTDLTIWGNSTAFMGIDSKSVQEQLGIECYNYGIAGIYHNELFHLQCFNKNNKGKKIIWVINPFEFLTNTNSKIDLVEVYSPFFNEERIVGYIKNNEFNTAKYFGWNHIFKLNAEHWKLILGGESRIKFNKFGNITFQKEFKEYNGYYVDDTLQFNMKRIKFLNNLIKEIKERNHLTVVIPPNLKKLNLEEFKSLIKHEQILDYSNIFSGKESFQDHVHINTSKVPELTNKFIQDYRLLINSN